MIFNLLFAIQEKIPGFTLFNIGVLCNCILLQVPLQCKVKVIEYKQKQIF